jgi:cellulose 1,4-beta-cellobiosidase
LPGAGSGPSAPVPSSAAATTPAAPAPTTFKTSKTVGGSTAASSATVTASPGDSSNPLKGKNFYANPFYASEVISLAAPSLVAAGSTALAAKATNVAKVGTFYWL